MRKLLPILILVLLPVPALAQSIMDIPSYQWDMIDEKDYHKSAVGIQFQTDDLQLRGTIGTGVIVRIFKDTEIDIDGKKYYKGWVLTCFHVARYDNGLDRIRIHFRCGETSKGYLKQWDSVKDYAIVSTLIPEGYPAAEIYDGDFPYDGGEIEFVGCGGDIDITSKYLRIFKTSLGKTSNPWIIRIDDVVIPGDSGGPVFYKGKLIGIMFAGCHVSGITPKGYNKLWGCLAGGYMRFRDDCLQD